MKRLQTMATLAAAGALLVVPAVGQANKPDANGNHNHPTGQGNGKGKGKSCAKKPTVNKGFVVKGTLVSATADDPATTNTNEGSVTITVTGQNRHARRAGLTDVDTNTAGTQYRLRQSDDSYTVKLSGYEGTDTPSVGDAVRIVGKVEVTRKKCAAPGTSLEDRYGDVDVRRVKVADRDPDA